MDSGIKLALVLTEPQARELERWLSREDLPPDHWKLADDLKELLDKGLEQLDQAIDERWQRPLKEFPGYLHDK